MEQVRDVVENAAVNHDAAQQPEPLRPQVIKVCVGTVNAVGLEDLASGVIAEIGDLRERHVVVVNEKHLGRAPRRVAIRVEKVQDRAE